MTKRLLTIQDISCVGQCSLTVALPLVSACGVECAVLPSAVLSTHTAGFSGYTFRDLTDDLPAIEAHWNKENIKFDAIYTGYLGSEKQIDYVASIMDTCLAPGGVIIVDPAMADDGKLYPAFDMDYVKAMRKLTDKADYIVPNLTEFNFLYPDVDPKEFKHGNTTLVLTGHAEEEGKTGVLVHSPEGNFVYQHEKLKENRHGTGDIYSSVFAGALLRGKSANDAAKIAAQYTLECVRAAQGDDEHFYGVRFEEKIPLLVQLLG